MRVLDTERPTDIRPFCIDIPQADLDDLADRLAWTRFTRGPAASRSGSCLGLGTVDGIADLGFALAAWFVDPDHNWIGLLQLKDPGTGPHGAATRPGQTDGSEVPRPGREAR